MLDVILIIVSALCMIAGLAGCVLPFLPGPPIAYLGLVFLHFTDKVHYTPTQLIIWLLIVAVVQVLDYFTPMLGSKYSGGSKWGNWGCMIGTIAGLFVLPPWGVLIGPFAGAVIFVHQCCQDSTMQRIQPPLIMSFRLPISYNIVAILIKLHMKSHRIARGTAKTHISIQSFPGINNLFHI